MSKTKNLKHRLRTDPDGMLGWMDGGYLPQVSYESTEITGIQLSMMLDGHEDVYVLTILPSDEYAENKYHILSFFACIYMIYYVRGISCRILLSVPKYLPTNNYTKKSHPPIFDEILEDVTLFLFESAESIRVRFTLTECFEQCASVPCARAECFAHFVLVFSLLWI